MGKMTDALRKAKLLKEQKGGDLPSAAPAGAPAENVVAPIQPVAPPRVEPPRPQPRAEEKAKTVAGQSPATQQDMGGGAPTHRHIAPEPPPILEEEPGEPETIEIHAFESLSIVDEPAEDIRARVAEAPVAKPEPPIEPATLKVSKPLVFETVEEAKPAPASSAGSKADFAVASPAPVVEREPRETKVEAPPVVVTPKPEKKPEPVEIKAQAPLAAVAPPTPPKVKDVAGSRLVGTTQQDMGGGAPTHRHTAPTAEARPTPAPEPPKVEKKPAPEPVLHRPVIAPPVAPPKAEEKTKTVADQSPATHQDTGGGAPTRRHAAPAAEFKPEPAPAPEPEPKPEPTIAWMPSEEESAPVSAKAPEVGSRPVLPEVEPTPKPSRVPYLSVHYGRDARLADEFRRLKARLCDEGPAKLILVVSPRAQEGKTTVALNLASSFANTFDEKVVVVDGNVSRPKIGEVLEVAADAPDLARVVAEMGTAHGTETAGQSPFQPAATEVGRLFAVPAPSAAERCDGLLDSDGMRELVASLRKRFTRVIVELPASEEHAEGLSLAALADVVLVPVMRSRSRRKSVRRLVEILKDRGAGRVRCVFVEA